MLKCQAEIITADSLFGDKVHKNILKSVEKAALVIIPTINGKCSYTFKQCLLRCSNAYLNLNDIIEILKLIKFDNISCLVALCRSIINSADLTTNLHRITDVIELCSGDTNIPKHKYDSILKCISYSDTLLIVTKNNFIPKPIVNMIPLAKSFSVKISILNFQ